MASVRELDYVPRYVRSDVTSGVTHDRRVTHTFRT